MSSIGNISLLLYRRFGPKQKFTVAAPGISGRVEQVKKEKKKEKKIKKDKKDKEKAGPNIHTQLADHTVESQLAPNSLFVPTIQRSPKRRDRFAKPLARSGGPGRPRSSRIPLKKLEWSWLLQFS